MGGLLLSFLELMFPAADIVLDSRHFLVLLLPWMGHSGNQLHEGNCSNSGWRGNSRCAGCGCIASVRRHHSAVARDSTRPGPDRGCWPSSSCDWLWCLLVGKAPPQSRIVDP